MWLRATALPTICRVTPRRFAMRVSAPCFSPSSSSISSRAVTIIKCCRIHFPSCQPSGAVDNRAPRFEGGENVSTFVRPYGECNADPPKASLERQLGRRHRRRDRGYCHVLRTGDLVMINVGIYDNLSNEDYHADEALGHSGAVTIMDQSPAHFLYQRTHPAEQKREFDIGTAVHTLVLETSTWLDRMLILPEEFTDYRTKAAQALRESA